MSRFSSTCCKRWEIHLPYWIYTFKRPIVPFPAILFWKHEISIVPWRLKIEKSMNFIDFLVLSSHCFLIVKSCVQHVFAGFRAIRCWKRTFFWWFRREKKRSFLWKNLHFVVCNSFIYDRIEFIFLQKTWNTFTLPTIHILMHNNTFAADFVLKTWNFHCTWRSKNWEFQILQIIDFLKTTKMIPECHDLLIARMCFLLMHRCVMDMQRHRNHYFLNLHTPLHPPLKTDRSSKYAENFIFQSRLSCWFWELVELLMALK